MARVPPPLELRQIMMYSLEDGECGACRMLTGMRLSSRLG